MKSFRAYIQEDIIGPYIHLTPWRERHVDMKTLYSMIEKNNVAPDPESARVPLNEEYHLRVSKDFDEPDYAGVTVHSNDPKYSHLSLMSYSISRIKKRIVGPDGKEHFAFTGYPRKALVDEVTSDFKIPSNLIHVLANHMGSAIISGEEHSMGGASFWKGAIEHGQSTGNHVYHVDRNSPNTFIASHKATTKNRKDAYSKNVTLRQKVPSRVSQETRTYRRLAVFPTLGK